MLTINRSVRGASALQLVTTGLGSGGLTEPSFDRYATPWTCFVDSGTGDGGGGGGDAPKTYSADDVAKMLAAETRKVSDRLSKQHSDALSVHQTELEELRQKLDTRSGGEDAAQRAAIDRKLAAAEKKLGEQAAILAKTEGELRAARIDSALDVRIAAHRLTPDSRRFALIGFKADAKVEFDERGKVAYVDIGGQTYTSVDSAFDAWMSTHGTAFAKDESADAKATAARLRDSRDRDLTQLSDDELILDSNRKRQHLGRHA